MEPRLFVEQIPETGTGTLFEDSDGFIGVSLEFNFHATHPQSGKLLRDWVTAIPGAAWSKSTRTWTIPDVRDIPRGTLKNAGFVVISRDGVPARPSDLAESAPSLEALARALDDVPEWFGVTPYPYQRLGAQQIVHHGRPFLTDEPGVGKTVTALCVAAMLQSPRTLVLCPPVALTHWERTTRASLLVEHITPTPGAVVVVNVGRKEPELPDCGVIIASAALVAGRSDLAQRLAKWQPTVFILDEAHQVKTWSSKRSRVLRRLARSCTFSLPLTGTPSPAASPLELAAQLDIAGLLEPAFGSYWQFRDRFATKSKWGWRPRKDRLKELNGFLESAWVRRTKSEVLPFLPPKVRATLWVDVDRAEYKRHLVEVHDMVDTWLDDFFAEHGRWPSNDRHRDEGDEVSDWCSGRGDIAARLRAAAGMAKVPAAVDVVREHVVAHPKTGGRWPAPLIVWVHHHSVSATLMESLADLEPRLIDGTTKQADRDDAVDDFEAGHVAVLVASIQAAGVGITLTRANEALFVELDWTPANIVQAEDRIHRIGQNASSVTYTTLVAADTLDERVADVLFGKSGVLDTMMSGDHAKAQRAVQRSGEKVFASTILAQIVAERLRKRSK